VGIVAAMAVFLIVVVALVGLALLTVVSLRTLGLDPEWAQDLRHAFGEIRYRADGVLAELGDFVRMGR